jgi:ribosomal protein S18 acetylase RimI-like enzyme
MDKMELDTLDGPGTREHLAEIQEVYTAAFQGYSLDDHRMRTLRQAESPAFTAITARDNGRLVGFAYGLALRGAGWWQGLEPPPERGFIDETGDRTFAVIDLAVLSSHRGHGLGRRLLNELRADYLAVHLSGE